MDGDFGALCMEFVTVLRSAAELKVELGRAEDRYSKSGRPYRSFVENAAHMIARPLSRMGE